MMYKLFAKMDKKFYIVRILNNSSNCRELFIVPGTFMMENQESGENYVHMLPPPLNSHDSKILLSSAQNYLKPPSNWPLYLCKILCTAGSYEHALIILEALMEVDTPNTFFRRSAVKRTASGQVKRFREADNDEEYMDEQISEPNSPKNIPSSSNVHQNRDCETPIQNIEALFEDPHDFNLNIKTVSVKNVSTQTNYSNSKEQMVTKVDLDEVMKKYFLELKNYIDKKMTSEIVEVDDIVDKKVEILVNQRAVDTDYGMTFNEFKHKHLEYEFPLKSHDEFTQFLTDIKHDNSGIREDFKKYLRTSVNFEIGMSDNLTILFKKFLTKEILKDYTSQRSKPGKMIFKDTEFYLVLEDVFLQVYTTYVPQDKIQQKHILSSVGLVFNNAKDWNGGRAARFKKIKTIK